jgi:hypothetical protein
MKFKTRPFLITIFLLAILAGPLGEWANRTFAQTAPENPSAAPNNLTTLEEIKKRIEQLGDNDFSVRDAATKWLTQVGRPAMPALQEALKSQDAEVSYRARIIIDNIQTSIVYLLANLKEKNPEVRKAAAETLERLGPAMKDAVPALIEAMKDPKEEVRDAAMSALLAFDSKLEAVAKAVPEKAHVSGKYEKLLRRIKVPADQKSYSDFTDFGHYQGTDWAGYTNLPPGYWVYVYPYWYIWGEVKN